MKKLLIFLHWFWFDKDNNKESIKQIKEAFPERDFIWYNALFPSGRERWGFARYLKNKNWEKDEISFQKNIDYLKTEIKKELEKRKLKWEDIVLCWRSQWAYTALYLWLTNESKCNTIISLCGFTDENLIKQINTKKSSKTIWFEAEQDTVLAKERKESHKLLKEKNICYIYIKDKTSDHDNLSKEGMESIIKNLKKI